MNSEKVAEYKELDTEYSVEIIKTQREIKAIVKGKNWSIEIPSPLAWLIIRDNAECTVWEIVSYRPYICHNETTEVYIAEEYVDLFFVDP